MYFLFPPHLKEVFYRSGLGNPEPFEIFSYVLLTVIFVLFFWLWNYKGSKIPIFFDLGASSLQRTGSHGVKKYGIENIGLILKIIILFFLLLLLLSKLGNFPLVGDVFPFKLLHSKLFYDIALIVYLAVVSFFILEIALLRKITKHRHILYLLVVIILTLITFVPHFQIGPIEGALFYGPTYEIAMGKTIFTQIPSQYGFLSILLFATIYKLTHLGFIYLPFLVWIMTVAEYFICFYLIYKVSKSAAFSLLGMFSILTVNYISGTYGAQGGPLRWLPIFLLLFLYYKFKRLESKSLIILLPLLVFWNIDSGIFLILGYFFTLFIFFLTKLISIKKLFFTVTGFIISMAVFIVAIEAVHLVLGYQMVDFLKIYHSVQKNAVIGMLMVPIGDQTYFWLFTLLYFASVIYFFSTQNAKIPVLSDLVIPRTIREGSHGAKKQGIEHFTNLILLSANLMLFASTYYVGRSMPHELITISVFAILTFFLLIGSLYSTMPTRIRLGLLLITFILFMAFPAFQRKEYITEKILDRIHSYGIGNIFSSRLDEDLTKLYAKDIPFIKQEMKDKKIVIISPDDTYLFYLTGKDNLLNIDPAFAIDMQSEMPVAVQSATEVCPEKIVIDCALAHRCQDFQPLTERLPALPFIQTEIEKKCGFSYQTGKCNEALCIAEHIK